MNNSSKKEAKDIYDKVKFNENAKQDFMTEVYSKLGIELTNEKYNFIELLKVTEHYANSRDCYLHYLIELHEECLKLDLTSLPSNFLKVVKDVNNILNASTESLGNVKFVRDKN